MQRNFPTFHCPRHCQSSAATRRGSWSDDSKSKEASSSTSWLGRPNRGAALGGSLAHRQDSGQHLCLSFHSRPSPPGPHSSVLSGQKWAPGGFPSASHGPGGPGQFRTSFQWENTEQRGRKKKRISSTKFHYVNKQSEDLRGKHGARRP